MASARINEICFETASFNDTATHAMCSFQVPDNSVIIAEATITGKDVSNKMVCAKTIAYGTKSSGDVSIDGVTDVIMTVVHTDNAGATATIAVSGNNIYAQVRGPYIAKNIDWQVQFKIQVN